MQHDWKHVERPGGSHTALDGKKVSEVLYPFPKNAGFADGLFVMTTATDHKNNLNRSVLKKDYTAPYG